MVRMVQLMNEHLDGDDEEGSDDEEAAFDVYQGDQVRGDLLVGPTDRIQHMRCAVHTLQLAIGDGLKDRHTAAVIGRLRAVAKEARHSKINEEIKRRANKVALLDQETRWGSIYLMIQRLVELKRVIKVRKIKNVIAFNF